MYNVVVLGAGIAGLATALGLARAGSRVTIVDRDPAPSARDPEEAFASWERASVPQARQPHAFWARSRNLLLANAPDVIDALHGWGIGEWSFIDLAPPELRVPEDDQFASLNVRRVPFEFTLRCIVDDEDRIDVRAGAVVDGLIFDERSDRTVAGVTLRDGEGLRADIVIDAGGRRTPVPGFLAARGIELPTEEEECGITYYGRYYRQDQSSTVDPGALAGRGGDLGYLLVAPFGGDHDTVGGWINPPSWDKAFRPLRHAHVWEAVARSLPALARIELDNSDPVTDVQAMAGHKNVMRSFVVDGAPLVHGLLPVGDALSTTNPMNGWGASLALTAAYAAVDAVAEHGNDFHELALAYADAVMDDLEAYYRESTAIDRIRTYQWRGVDVPAEDRLNADRQQLLRNGLAPAMRRDMHVLRAMLRRMMLIDPPDTIWSDERALTIAKEVADWRAKNKPPTALGPSRDEMLEIIAEAEAYGSAGRPVG